MSGRIIKCACFYLKRNRPFDEAVIIPIPIFASPPLTLFSLSFSLNKQKLLHFLSLALLHCGKCVHALILRTHFLNMAIPLQL